MKLTIHQYVDDALRMYNSGAEKVNVIMHLLLGTYHQCSNGNGSENESGGNNDNIDGSSGGYLVMFAETSRQEKGTYYFHLLYSSDGTTQEVPLLESQFPNRQVVHAT